MLYAQTEKPYFILSNDESGSTRTYVARNYITLKEGFNYTASEAETFNAVIDTTLHFDVTYIQNPTPGNTSDSTNDEEYTPGNTFGYDPTGNVSGLVKIKSTSDRNDTSHVFPVLWFKTVPLTNNLNGAYLL
jgi:hypothetical protein